MIILAKFSSFMIAVAFKWQFVLLLTARGHI